ncbi:MAG TPA: pseudouridine synthase, partial [Dysgonomonas sp.]|nr:pseudouridine synthase [Dysgonomonas sp.]
MITDRDNERRDGYSSSTNRNGQGEVKKKRPRVGDTRTTVNRESSNYNNNRSNNNSYQSNRDSGSGGYQRGGGSGYQRSGGSGYQSGGGYQGGDRNNNNRRPVSRNQNQRGAAPTGQKFMKKPKQLVKPVKYKENIDPDTLIRLNKYLANAGVCSRREADAYIAAGVVKVNGEVVNELGTKVRRGDMISFHDQPVRL